MKRALLICLLLLTSVAVDMHVTQAVDGVRGVHAMLPKSIFTKGK